MCSHPALLQSARLSTETRSAVTAHYLSPSRSVCLSLSVRSLSQQLRHFAPASPILVSGSEHERFPSPHSACAPQQRVSVYRITVSTSARLPHWLKSSFIFLSLFIFLPHSPPLTSPYLSDSPADSFTPNFTVFLICLSSTHSLFLLPVYFIPIASLSFFAPSWKEEWKEKQAEQGPSAQIYELCSSGSFKRNLVLVYRITVETLSVLVRVCTHRNGKESGDSLVNKRRRRGLPAELSFLMKKKDLFSCRAAIVVIMV